MVALVHDLGPTNLRTWKIYGTDSINSKKVSFRNQNADKDIFVFADVSHID